jgi:hypothetical protein
MYRVPLSHRSVRNADLDECVQQVLKDVYVTGTATVPTTNPQLLYLVKNALYNSEYRWQYTNRGTTLRISERNVRGLA